jgi:predicted transcriptional regulator
MLVSEVFTATVVRTSRSTTLQEAAQLMRRQHVGALVVTDEGMERDRPLGIVTDRDIVIKAVAEGMAVQHTTVGEIMTQALATVLRTDTLQQALELMRTRGVRRLAVAEPNGEIAGIVSIDDIVDRFAAEVGAMHGILANELSREIAQVPKPAA